MYLEQDKVLLLEKVKNQFYIFDEPEFSGGTRFDFIKRFNLDKKIVDKTRVHGKWIVLLFKNSSVKFLNVGKRDQPLAT